VSNESHQPEPTLRASDTEREQTVSALRAHHAAGRLQTNELDQRIATALTATTVTELDDQLRDLPNLRTEQSGRRWKTRRLATILPLPVAATAIALSNGARLIWILALLWFAGRWHRHRPRIAKDHRDLALRPVTREGSRT
jgi:hypothetical protein